MTVSVVIAYRDFGDVHRRASFEFVHAWYKRFGWEIVIHPGAKRFSRAQAINAGVRHAAGDVIVQSDPDSVVPDEQLTQAVYLAAEADGLVIPHDRYLYLDEAATARVLADGWIRAPKPSDCEEHGINGSGNVTVFSRTTWEKARGFDERFEVWGGDDAAYRLATEAFVAPLRRVPGDMAHLYHPRLPQSVPGHPGYLKQMSILSEYRDAAAIGPEAVRKLVESRVREEST